MSVSGHVTRNIFDRYNITSEADFVAAAERVERYVEAAERRVIVESVRGGRAGLAN